MNLNFMIDPPANGNEHSFFGMIELHLHHTVIELLTSASPALSLLFISLGSALFIAPGRPS